MKEIGIAETRAHVKQLNETLSPASTSSAVPSLSCATRLSRGALAAIRSTDEHALVGALAEDGPDLVARRQLRVSAHCYNTHEDIETLLEALARHRALLA